MSHRQEPIYSVLKILNKSRVKPKVRSIPAPETFTAELIKPDNQPRPGEAPVTPDFPSNGVAAIAAPEGQVSEIEVNPPPRVFPVIRLSAGSHNFGEVVVGEYADWGVTLRNQGETEGIVSEIKGLPKGAVSLVDPSPLPWIIPPHGVRCITFRYAPDLPGAKLAGHLTLTTNDPDFPDQEVWLSGIGMGLRPQLDGSPPEIANSLRMAFQYVPAGTYLMGSPEHEPGRNDDEVPHTVSLTRSFYLQTTPVTQGQWQALMGSNPMSLENCDPDCPVEQVSWHDCQGFINRLNALGEGRYRLPTEAEWEYASRAGSPMAFALGEITALFCAHDPSLDRMGWYCGNSDWQSHPVARKAPNAWGLYDMHGNVYEWCQDWYGEYPGSSDTDPEGPASGARKVIRGGSCFSSVKTCRSAARSSWAPQEKAPFLGLRLVREI